MFNVRLAGGHLYGKQLFTWLSLVVSFMASFVLSFFPLNVLDGIWDLIESVSEGFLTYSFLILSGRLSDIHQFMPKSGTQCPICFKVISRRANLGRHVETHSTVKRFNCNICSKRFRRKQHLTGHQLNVHKLHAI